MPDDRHQTIFLRSTLRAWPRECLRRSRRAAGRIVRLTVLACQKFCSWEWIGCTALARAAGNSDRIDNEFRNLASAARGSERPLGDVGRRAGISRRRNDLYSRVAKSRIKGPLRRESGARGAASAKQLRAVIRARPLAEQPIRRVEVEYHVDGRGVSNATIFVADIKNISGAAIRATRPATAAAGRHVPRGISDERAARAYGCPGIDHKTCAVAHQCASTHFSYLRRLPIVAFRPSVQVASRRYYQNRYSRCLPDR